MSNQGFATPSLAIAHYSAVENLNERDELACFIFETTRSIYGYKPRWNYSEWTLEQLREEADQLGAQVKAEREREIEEKKQRVREANAKALAARKFQKNFGSLANAF